MSDILASMIVFLQASASITELVGERIYPEKFPAGTTASPTTLPCVTYQLIDEPAALTHDGKSTYKARVQIDAWGGTYKSAHAVADALHAQLHGYRGHWSPFEVGLVIRKAKRDQSDADLELKRLVQDFVIHYAER